MYLISVSALTDKDLCLTHHGKTVMAVNRTSAGYAMAALNVHVPDAKPILVTHHHCDFITSITPANGRYVCAPHGESACHGRQRTSAALRLALTCEPDNHGIAAMRGFDYLACTALTAICE